MSGSVTSIVCFRSWFGVLGLSISCAAIARSSALVQFVLHYVAFHRVGQSGKTLVDKSALQPWGDNDIGVRSLVLHDGGLHHSDGGRMAAASPTPQGTLHRPRVSAVLFDRLDLHH